jgi:hypothetical protein
VESLRFSRRRGRSRRARWAFSTHKVALTRARLLACEAVASAALQAADAEALVRPRRRTARSATTPPVRFEKLIQV